MAGRCPEGTCPSAAELCPELSFPSPSDFPCRLADCSWGKAPSRNKLPGSAGQGCIMASALLEPATKCLYRSCFLSGQSRSILPPPSPGNSASLFTQNIKLLSSPRPPTLPFPSLSCYSTGVPLSLPNCFQATGSKVGRGLSLAPRTGVGTSAVCPYTILHPAAAIAALHFSGHH